MNDEDKLTLKLLVEKELAIHRGPEYERSLHRLFQMATGFPYNSPAHRMPQYRTCNVIGYR